MDTTARILVETQQGVQNLKNLEKELISTNAAFAGLKNVVLGFATAGFITGLFKMANELTDMAAATGVSTQAILGFGKAVSANGGDVEGATAGIAKFVIAIGNAANGSKESQDAFKELGVSLTDLRTLSEEDLLKKATAGFKEGMNASEKLTLAVALFGKTARSWDMSKVNSELQYYIDKSKEAAGATDAAGEVSQRFGNAFKELGSQILVALKPLSELALMVTENKEAISTAIKVVVDFGAAWLIFAKIIPMVHGALAALGASLAASGGAIAALQTALMGVVAGFIGFGANILRAVGILPSAYGGVASLTFALSGLLRGLLRFAGLAGIFYAIYEALDFLIKKLSGSGIVEWVTKAGEALGLFQKKTEDSSAADKKKADAQRDVKKAVDEFAVALAKTVDGYNETIRAAQRKYELDLKNITASREQTNLNAMLADAETNYLKTVTDLKEKYLALTTAGDSKSMAQAKQVAKAMTEVGAAYSASVSQMPAMAANLEKTTVSTEALTQANKSLADASSKVRDIQHEMLTSTMNPMEKIRANAIRDSEKLAEADIAQAAAAAKLTVEQFKQRNPADVAKYVKARIDGAKDIADAETEAYQRSREFSTGWTQAFQEYANNATNAATIAKNVFAKFTTGIEDMLVNFFKTGKLGWKEFLASMAEEVLRSQIRATLASMMDVFGGKGKGGVGGILGGLLGSGKAKGSNASDPMWVKDVSSGGIQSGIEGKPSGPGMVESIKTTISDFATSVSDFLGSMFDGLSTFIGDFSSSLGNILSSVGGTLYDILSNVGSTLFDFLGSLGSSLGDIIGMLGSSLGDVLSSVGGMFGGSSGGGGGILSTLFDIGASLFGFAGGGVIPNNGPVLVGEKGPELLYGSQGAAVVPMGAGGGSTNVTYNINAVDARSFKEMIAADPTFIYAVTQQGAKSIPRRY